MTGLHQSVQRDDASEAVRQHVPPVVAAIGGVDQRANKAAANDESRRRANVRERSEVASAFLAVEFHVAEILQQDSCSRERPQSNSAEEHAKEHPRRKHEQEELREKE